MSSIICKFHKIKDNANAQWKLKNEIFSRGNPDFSTNLIKSRNEKILTDPCSIANEFNKFFIELKLSQINSCDDYFFFKLFLLTGIFPSVSS